jgi:outer membrane protein, multidrug efflux system
MQRPATGRGRRAPYLLAVSAGALVAGCATLPVYEAPEMRLTDRYSILQPVSAGPRQDGAWWRAMQDPVLDQLVARALAQNLTIAEARSRLAEAEAQARRARVSNVGGDGSVDVSVTPGSGGDSAAVGLSAVFSPTRRAETAAARARLEAARHSATDARRLVIAEIALTYTDLRYAQQLLEYRRQDLVSRQRTRRDITTQFEAGAATRLDVVRANALVAQTEAQLPETEAVIVTLRNRLSTLMGEPAGSGGLDLRATGRQPLPVRDAGAGVPADLLRTRPDVRAAERLYAAAVSDIGVAEAARWPQLSLSGTIRAPLDGGGTAESLGLGLSLPVFSQPALAAGVDAAGARAEQALVAWRRAVLVAVEEVENALAALSASRRSAAAAARVVALNQEALTLSRQLFFESGEATVLDVLDRERAVSEARATLAQAQRDVARDYIRLSTALGIEDGLGEMVVAPADMPYSTARK